LNESSVLTGFHFCLPAYITNRDYKEQNYTEAESISAPTGPETHCVERQTDFAPQVLARYLILPRRQVQEQNQTFKGKDKSQRVGPPAFVKV